ncbi:MAG: PorT family protein [Tannerellaceae bacterium]|jgi:hypothetical protein|nr:PorT family protein [Tannerellaceae bacterium]
MWVLPISAQSIFLTPRAGLNLSTITQTGGSLKSGLNFGLSGEYLHSSRIGIEVGMNYSMQGSRFKFADVSPEHNYLNMPVLFKYYVKELETVEGGGSKGLSVFAGPQLDLKVLVNKVGYTAGKFNTLLTDDMTQPLGTSFVIGSEYLFDNGLAVSINLNFGLTNKVKKSYADNTAGSYRDFVAQFKFGYRFSIN